jgi:hypothetical protein
VNATGREILLENCNNGGYVPYGLAYGPHWHRDPERDPPMTDQGCPFNMFRVGSDIAPSPLSTVSNLLQVGALLVCCTRRTSAWCSRSNMHRVA